MRLSRAEAVHAVREKAAVEVGVEYMKKSNWKYFIAVIPLALVLTSCGQKSAEDGESGSAKNSFAAPAPSGGNGNGNGGGTNNNTNASCATRVVTKPLIPYTVSGTGNGTASSPSSTIMADQTLKIQVTPQAGGASTSGGNYQSYDLMAFDVQLLANGSEVSGAKIHLPQSGSYYYGGPSKGMVVGNKSAVLDFSAYAQQLTGKKFSFRIKSVATDWKCKVFCMSTFYCGYVGYTYMCDTYMINQCKQMNCDVGPATSTQTWSVYMQVETDTTPCLQ